MTNFISNQLLTGRPFDGVAIIVKQNLAAHFNAVRLSSRYIILKTWSTLFINVYLPCISADDWENEYLECLACITNDISDVQYKNIIMCGDLNLDFTSMHPLTDVLCNFMENFSLSNLDSRLPPNASYSFRVDASAASSLIDHFLDSIQLCDSANMVDIVDSGINLSDHCAVVMELLLPLMQSGLNKVYSKPRKSHVCHYSYRWDKADLSKYYAASFEYLNSIQVPVQLLCADYLVTKENIQLDTDCFYHNIVDALHNASGISVPKMKSDFYKFWWDEELSALKQASLDSYNLWLAIGKPRFGCEFMAIKRAKSAYKLAIKTKERNSQNKFTNSLNEALLNKDMESFWRSWKSKFGSKGRSTVIEGCSDDNISNKFATIFQSICIPNSQSHHDSLKAKFQCKFGNSIGNSTPL